jgi:hypothetical protein
MIVGTGAALSHGGVGGGVTSTTVVVVAAVNDGDTMPVASKVSCGPVSGGSSVWPPGSQPTSIVISASVTMTATKPAHTP